MTRRVLSYPPVHDYVDRLHGHGADLVHRDEDWPRLPRFYSAAWVRRHAAEWDVAHLHFTWEQHPVDEVEAVLDAHAEAGVPVVWTAHDLRNPHTPAATADLPYLELLAERADEVITLTPGAAGELRARFGREARVIPHGPLVPSEEALTLRSAVARRPSDRPVRVLVHAKGLRANLDLDAVIAAADGLDPAAVEVVIGIHREEVDVDALRRRMPPGATLHPHARLSAAELWRAIAATDALLLPYRWGTHSGMVELAADLGTLPVVTDVGYLSEQTPCTVVPVRDGGVDVEGLHRTLATLDPRAVATTPVEVRRQELRDVRDRHADVYAQVTSGRRDRGRAVS